MPPVSPTLFHKFSSLLEYILVSQPLNEPEMEFVREKNKKSCNMKFLTKNIDHFRETPREGLEDKRGNYKNLFQLELFYILFIELSFFTT